MIMMSIKNITNIISEKLIEMILQCCQPGGGHNRSQLLALGVVSGISRETLLGLG